MAQGTVKWINAGKGHGFTAPDDGTSDVFAHHSAIQADGYRSLQENQRAEYTTVRGPTGPQAGQVQPVQPRCPAHPRLLAARGVVLRNRPFPQRDLPARSRARSHITAGNRLAVAMRTSIRRSVRQRS